MEKETRKLHERFLKGVTEAGTTQRDVVREGVVQIGATFRVSKPIR